MASSSAEARLRTPALPRVEPVVEGESPRAIQLTRAGGVLQRNLKDAGRHSKELAVFL